MSKSILILIIISFLAVTNVAAQDAFTPYEGTQKTYKVNNHPESNYQWNVYTQLNPLVAASSSAFTITNNGSPQVSILWVKTGAYYLLVTETDASGCTNTKAARVEVLSNTYTIQFANLSSNQCYASSFNYQAFPIRVIDSSSQPADANRFPITVNYTINGTPQAAQILTFASQALVIPGSSLAANPNQDTQVIVKITGATDSQNQTIQPETTSGQNIHTHTIFAQPQIQFVQTGTASFLQGEQGSFAVTGSNGNTYQYALLLPDGSTQTLTSTTSQSGNITFAQTGVYTLRVQATDTKGCLSEWIAKTIQVGSNVPLQAVADAASTSADMPVTIDVLANDQGVTANTQPTVPPKSVQGATLVRNANGSVTYTPASGFWGNDSFTYQLCAGVQTTACSTATVTVAVENPAVKNTGILAITDINNTWAGTTVSGNVLTNDLFYDAALVEAKIVTIPLAESGKLTHFDKKMGDYTFVPAEGYTGEAIFEYQICQQDKDGKTVCSTSNVSIKILDSGNQTPVANNDVVVTTYNTAVKGNFLRNDYVPGTGNLSISQVRSSGLKGTLKWDANGDFSYTPPSGFSGEEHFTYQVCNGTAKCDWGTVSIFVMSPNLLQNSLYANYDAYFTGSLLTGNLSDNDFNNSGAGLVYKVTPVTGPAHGTVQLKPDGSFTYIPGKGVLGQITDQFVVEACTSGTSQQCSKETVYIVGNISKINLLASTETTTGACLPVVLDASASTGVGALTYRWSPETYLSDPGSSKPVFKPGKSTDYTLTVTDQSGNTASKTVHVKVDVAPQISTANQVFVQSPSEVIMLDASASTGNNLKFNWSATQGGMIVSGAQTDKPQIKGVGKYYLQVADRYGCTALDSVVVGLYIHVKAVADTGETKLNLAVDINVLANDIPKTNLNPTTLRIVTPPQNGIATVVGDSLVSYLPNSYFVGSDSFIYSICDYLQHCDQATVLVLVNDLPFFIPEAFSPNGDGINDEFVINGLSKYKSVEITIFNRWGNTVYHSGNYGEGQGKGGFWNGTASQGLRFGSGPVPTGTYFYILKLDGKEKINGAVYLDR